MVKWPEVALYNNVLFNLNFGYHVKIKWKKYDVAF